MEDINIHLSSIWGFFLMYSFIAVLLSSVLRNSILAVYVQLKDSLINIYYSYSLLLAIYSYISQENNIMPN